MHPFGFKGGNLTELWQSIVGLRDSDGNLSIGVGVQSVLWSDSNVFAHFGEAAGNRLMADMTAHALSLAAGSMFDTPFGLLDELLPKVYEFGRQMSGFSDLRAAFALNALVPVDQAAWGLYRIGRGPDFERVVPEAYRALLSERQRELAGIPVVGYGQTEAEIGQLLDEGYFLLKIKIGANPVEDGDPAKMLNWDRKRLETIHRIASRYETGYTRNGKIAYYLDANGRYDSKERLFALLDHVDRIGALDRVVLLEEPFDESDKTDVYDIPVRCAADESICSKQDALERIQMGYGAIALKPVAKTMSLSLKIASIARSLHIPCFCADLTANPLLADWNKTLAAYLPPLPELTVGAFETNGRQNYRDWERMKRMHPQAGASWSELVRGVYKLDERFFETLGGSLDVGPQYERALDAEGEPQR